MDSDRLTSSRSGRLRVGTVCEFMTSFTAVAGHRSHLNEGVSDGYAEADRDRGAGRAGRSKSEVARRYGVSRRWVISVVQRSGARRNAARVGRREEVLVEGPSRTDPARSRGRTRRNTTVVFSGDAAAGQFVDVLIERATSTTLRGRAPSLVAAEA